MSASLEVNASVTHHISSPADFTDKMEDDGGIQGDAEIPDMTCHGSVELTAAEKILKECNQLIADDDSVEDVQFTPEMFSEIAKTIHDFEEEDDDTELNLTVDATSSQHKLGKSSSNGKNKQRSRGKAEGSLKEGIPQVAGDVDTSLHESVGVDATSSQQMLEKSSSKAEGSLKEGIPQEIPQVAGDVDTSLYESVGVDINSRPSLDLDQQPSK